MSQVYFCPESPRWLIQRGKYDKAYESLARLRNHPIQAARDLYCKSHPVTLRVPIPVNTNTWHTDIHVLLEAAESISRGRNRYLELFTIPRNRRASLASFIVMFMQQFCGVNVIAYYSTNVFKQAGNTDTQAFLASFGFGAGELFSGMLIVGQWAINVVVFCH